MNMQASAPLGFTIKRAIPWLLLASALALLYVPTFTELAKTLWSTDQNSHGPIVLAMAAWFFWFQGHRIAQDATIQRSSWPLGWLVIALGLAMYVLGQSQGIHLLSMGSLLPVMLGVVLVYFGTQVAGKLWFAFFFLFFAVPLPGAVVDTLTHPMKIGVSWASEHLLWQFGIPVSRAGVVLNVGQYQLLVADACAGLNSLFTLEALGLMYMNIRRHESALRNTLLAVLIVPISFTANVIRVIVLCLITYYLGDAAGQGFLHTFSGMVLFISALLLVIATDGLLRRLSSRLER
ncbi:exosortase B [Pelomonas sp. HMWF004]|nr:exosortase B [Pelomonas sp. HMWF004]